MTSAKASLPYVLVGCFSWRNPSPNPLCGANDDTFLSICGTLSHKQYHGSRRRGRGRRLKTPTNASLPKENPFLHHHQEKIFISSPCQPHNIHHPRCPSIPTPRQNPRGAKSMEGNELRAEWTIYVWREKTRLGPNRTCGRDLVF